MPGFKQKRQAGSFRSPNVPSKKLEKLVNFQKMGRVGYLVDCRSTYDSKLPVSFASSSGAPNASHTFLRCVMSEYIESRSLIVDTSLVLG